MNTKQLYYVQVLAEEGSFSRAAEALNISQPSLSQYVKKIEQQLGTEIFDRSGSELKLTEAGKVYLETGRRILDLERQMDTRLQDLSEYKTGTVVLGAAPFRSEGLMPRVAVEFKKLYLGMTLSVDERTTAELLEATEKGEVDMALTTLPVDERLFDYQIVLHEEMVIAVPTASELERTLSAAAVEMDGRKYPAVDICLLRGADFVMIKPTQVIQRLIDKLSDEYRLELKTSVVVQGSGAKIAMVRAGLGATMIPVGADESYDDGSVTYFSVLQELPRREVAIIYRRDRMLSEPQQALIDLMQRLYG